MNKLFLFMLLLVFSYEAFAQYNIEGKVNANTNVEILLVKNGEKGLEDISKATVVNGIFKFEGNVETLTIAHIMTPDKKGIYATIMLEDGDYFVTQTSDTWVVTGGGDNHKIWEEFDKINKYASKITTQFKKQAQKATSENQLIAMQNAIQQTLHSLQLDEVELLKKYNNTMPAAYVVSQSMMSLTPSQLEEHFNILGKDAKLTFIGKKIAARIAHIQKLKIGMMAPDFNGALSDGGVITLYEARAKAKLVVFYSSTDDKSRQCNVHLLQLYKRFRPKGLEIISVSLDDNEQIWLKAIGQDGNTWLNILDSTASNASIAELYCVTSLPTNYLMDVDNRIVAINIYESELEKKIDHMLKKKK